MDEPSKPTLWERLNNLVLLRFLLLFACGWATIQILEYFELVLFIFISSTILAFLLSYPVYWLKRFLPHGLSVVVVFFVGLGLIGGITGILGLAVLSQGQRLATSLTDFLNSLPPLMHQLEVLLGRWDLNLDLQTVETQLKNQALSWIGASLTLVQAALTNFVTAILIAVVTFFMMLDGHQLWAFLLKILPPHTRERFTVTVQRNLLGFFWGRLLLSVFFAISTFFVFLALRIPFALTLAVVVASFDLIPGIGATLGIGLVSLILLSEGFWLAIQALVTCVLLQQVQENLLLPHVMRGALNINPVVMFFALIVGARVAGLMGIFLAIPVAGVVVSLLEIEEMKGRPDDGIPPQSPPPRSS